MPNNGSNSDYGNSPVVKDGEITVRGKGKINIWLWWCRWDTRWRIWYSFSVVFHQFWGSFRRDLEFFGGFLPEK